MKIANAKNKFVMPKNKHKVYVTFDKKLNDIHSVLDDFSGKTSIVEFFCLNLIYSRNWASYFCSFNHFIAHRSAGVVLLCARIDQVSFNLTPGQNLLSC